MRRSTPLVLALDVGTSSCRASLYDARGRRLPGVGAQVQYRPLTTPEGGAELDPETLFAAVCRTIDGVSEQMSAAVAQRVAAVASTTFWHSLLGVDRSGCAVTPLYLWLDARSRAQATALRRELDERAVHARTGCMLHWSYWPAKLRWLQATQPELVQRTCHWLSFGEYLALRLLGKTATSVSMASGTGLLDQHTADWDDALLDVLGVGRTALAPLAQSDADLGRLLPEFGARWPWLRALPWLAAVGDGATSNVGAGCTTRERVALMIGTSGALRALWATPDVTIPWGTWCYRLDRQRVVMGGALNDGGSLFAWLRNSLKLPTIAAAEQEIAAMPPDRHGLTILPFWAGERSPGWAADARGAILGLRLDTSPVEIQRAALEAVALQFARIDAVLQPVLPAAHEVIATGGALLRSPAWMQIVADALGRPVAASAEPEASSRGAALVAFERLGRLAEPLETLRPAVTRVFEPVPAHVEQLQAAAARQQRLYELLIGDVTLEPFLQPHLT